MNQGRILPLIALLFSRLLITSCSADVIKLNDGQTILGTVVQTNEVQVLVLAEYGSRNLLLSEIKEIKVERNRQPITRSKNTVTKTARIPDWRTIISRLAPQVWTSKLRQVPATVVTNGIMRNVPYISFKCGMDYEINIYGDLDNPAAIEVGMYHDLIKVERAKENAINFVSSILLKDSDRDAAKKLNRTKDLQTHDGMTFEITPETAEDSYGGWWISVYDDKALEGARVSDSDIATISILNSSVISITNPPNAEVIWTKEDLKEARTSYGFTTQSQVAPLVPRVPNIAPESEPSYTPSSTYRSGSSSSSGGSVYVKGYYRKNGTYVSPHTRSRPRR